MRSARTVKVLLVDDSIVIRRLLTDILSGDPAIEVVGTAGNGKIALEKIETLHPDVVVLDVEMPVMTGLETLPHLRANHPRLPVIMFSTLTTRGGTATLDALSLGATDYVAKPANVGSVQESRERIRAELIPKIRVLGGAPPADATPRAPARRLAAPLPAPTPRRTASGRVDAVLVAVSTGGPKALQDVVPALDPELPVPVFVVQHMPPIFTALLAERLDKSAGIAVSEAIDGEAVRPGHVYLAPGDQHMVVARRAVTEVHLRLNQDEPENSCRPAADPLFRSAVQVYGGNLLAVVLTGMGQDGCRGAEAVFDAGGQVFAQDEATSVVWGMPGFVSRAGLADSLVPLPDVAGEINRRVRGVVEGARFARARPGPVAAMPITTAEFDYIRELVRDRSAIVLEPGKEYLVESRLVPLARQEGIDGIAALVDRLRRRATGPETMLENKVVEAMTTNETSFFRDQHPWESLRVHVLPDLVAKRRATRTLNVWSAACSSGQEAYTTAMVIREHFPELATWHVRIVGTDLSQEMVDRATEGRFAQIEANRGLPAPMLVKYFERAGMGWQVKRELKTLCEFRTMNLVKPWGPMPRFDIVFLRNVLIYFDLDTKRRIFDDVRRVLADGYLYLGAAETTVNIHDGFERLQFERAGCYRPRT